MNSRRRSDIVCARVTRAPQAHDVSPMMRAMTMGLAWPMKAASTSSSGSCGMTSAMLVRKLMTSSTQPPK